MFKLYFAGWGSRDADEYMREKKVYRLCSQINERKVINWWQNSNLSDRLFIDSGAFSVAHSGADVDIDSYIAYINENTDIKNWAELDVIPYPILNSTTAMTSSIKSFQNYVYMKQRVQNTNILPVYHFGEPKDGLKKILNTDIGYGLPSYICVGGRHGVSTENQAQYFNEIFYIIQNSDNPNVRVHAFGITVPKLLENFPFYSADSTTWLQVAINGMILLKDLSTCVISNGTISDPNNLQHFDKSLVNHIFDEIDYFGYDINELCCDYKLRLRYNIDVMQNWADNYKYRGPKKFKSRKLF